MSKLDSPTLEAGYRSVQKLGEFMDDVADALDKTLSRDGTAPNQMEAPLDMNSQRILNLPAPVYPNDPVRLQDIGSGGDVIVNPGSGPAVWSEIIGKPDTFPPGPTTSANITDFQEAVEDRVGASVIAGTNVNVTYDDSTGKTTVSATAPPSGSVAWADVTGKPTTFTPASHTHDQSEVVGLVAALAGKAPTVHTHAQSDITNLVSDLSGKASTSALTSGLAGKSDVGHTHTASNITDFDEAARDALGAALVAGANVTISVNDAANTITISATGGGGSGVPTGYSGAAENSITVAASAATNASNLNTLITTLSTAGGGTIWFNSPGNFQINSTIILKSYVDIKMTAGSYLYWTGSTGGTIVETITNDTLRGLKGTVLNIHSGSGHTGNMFYMHAAITNVIDVYGYGTSTGNQFVTLYPNSNHTPTTPGANNIAFNRIRIHHEGSCGIGMIAQGLTSGYGGQPNVITLNTFIDTTFYQGVQTYGILLRSWCDNNQFQGFTYILCTGSGSLGLGVNDTTPTVETGVYQIHFDMLAIDTFGSGLGRTGVILNASKGITCDAFYQLPIAEVADLVGTNCISYQFRQTKADNTITYRQKGIGTPTT